MNVASTGRVAVIIGGSQLAFVRQGKGITDNSMPLTRKPWPQGGGGKQSHIDGMQVGTCEFGCGLNCCHLCF